MFSSLLGDYLKYVITVTRTHTVGIVAGTHERISILTPFRRKVNRMVMNMLQSSPSYRHLQAAESTT